MITQCPECKSRYRVQSLPEGQLSAKVKCPKCGSAFTVEAAAERGLNERATILMIDDARFFRELMADLLEGCPFKLLTADTAAAGLALLRNQAVDLLIIDINLPDKNGLDLIREIRADQKMANLAILAISGVYRKDDDAVAAIRAGADDFSSKSFKPDELIERIDKLLKK